ncbi:hypothetical protein Q1695_010285 [Nippostrongylus brasiliensis]|nr:hypothetical protein Q1695_010285 [Nippostrongylus brasiliensis]
MNNTVPIMMLPEPFVLKDSEMQTMIIAVLIASVGVALVLFAEHLEKHQARAQQMEALLARDRMIIPPRCDMKSKEMGLTGVQPWRDYFTRDEPFVPTP